jgi:hypothetical protein
MFEGLNKQDKLSKAKGLFQDSIDSDVKNQTLFHDDFRFRDGFQWTAEEKRIMMEELRPALTLNLTKSSCDLVMGLNEDNRVQYRAVPVADEDDFLCEVINDLTDWVGEDQGFEEIEDSAFESAVICGRGYVGVDFVPDPKNFGEITLTEVDIPVHEVHYDPASRKPDWKDCSYICWDKWLNREEFKIRYPKFPDHKIDNLIKYGRTMGDVSSLGMPSDVFDESYPEFDADDSDYDREMDLNFYDRTKNQIRLIHMEYWQTFKRYFAFHPETGQAEEFDSKQLKDIQENYEKAYKRPFEYEVMLDKKVKWLQFIGDYILYDGDSPMPFEGFSIVPIFAFRDVSKRTNNHYGIVRIMKDAQKEVNKRWSQMLNMLNQQVQPGLFAEAEAFVNDVQAEASLKEAGTITWLNAGGLQKIKERGMPQFPNAVMQLEQFSQDMMRKVTGINPDLLGMDRGRQEPGVVVRLRQQQGLILLKPLMRAYKFMQKELFKRRVAIILGYMPDSQLLKIMGEGERYAVQNGQLIDQMSIDEESGQPTLVAGIRDLKNLKYNIQAEEAPGNMSKRMLEMTALLEMQKNGFPVDPKVIINKMDLPASEKKAWIAYIEGQQQAQAQAQEEAQQAEMQFKAKELEIKEQANQVRSVADQLDFFVKAAKINQMADQDEGKRNIDIMRLIAENKQEVTKFFMQLADMQAKMHADEGKMQTDMQKQGMQTFGNVLSGMISSASAGEKGEVSNGGEGKE